jgi:hypothetical protein
MSEKSIVEKLFIKPGQIFSLINSPEGYKDLMGVFPADVEVNLLVKQNSDIIQYFVRWQSDLRISYPLLKNALKPGGSLWVTYPKISAKAETDLNRDIIWHIGEEFGIRPTSMIAVDEVWSAMRMRII